MCVPAYLDYKRYNAINKDTVATLIKCLSKFPIDALLARVSCGSLGSMVTGTTREGCVGIEQIELAAAVAAVFAAIVADEM